MKTCGTQPKYNAWKSHTFKEFVNGTFKNRFEEKNEKDL